MLTGCGAGPVRPHQRTTSPDALPDSLAGSSAHPPGVPDPRSVDGNDAAAISRAAAITMWTLTATEHSVHDAVVRTMPYLTPGYAAQLARAGAGAPLPDAWMRNRLRALVRVQPGAEDAGSHPHPGVPAMAHYRHRRRRLRPPVRSPSAPHRPRHPCPRHRHPLWRISAVTPSG